MSVWNASGRLSDLTRAIGTRVEPARLTKLLNVAGAFMVDEHQPEVFATHGQILGESWRPTLRGGDPLGSIRTSFRFRVSGDSLEVYSTHPFAAVHNEGATIGFPNAPLTKGQKLYAIPLPTLSDEEAKRRPRSFANSFVQKSRKGNLLVFQKLVDGLRPLFALKPGVFIPRRTNLKWSPTSRNWILAKWADLLTERAA